MNKIKSPHRIYFNNNISVYQLPKSQYAIIEMNKDGFNRVYRVIECYLKEVNGLIEVRTLGDLPFKDYDYMTDALKHIEYNFKIEVDIIKSKVIK